MKLIEKTLLRLNRISPSQYSSLKRCAYRVVLANTYKNPLLPYPPNGHLGNVIHECIRLILTKQIQDDKEFNDLWSKLIEEEEAILKKLGFDFLTPLKRTVKGYSIKKLQVKSLLRKGVRNVKDKKKRKVKF